ncbi:hypothetical protein IWW48_000926 [Coemansia sp. RSA 1200]|nr:hypothetical protein IWW48_000926 [Coemansia sp. RSA 1200]
MHPEEKSFVLEPGRIRRVLRKLLAKVTDLEEEIMLRPSVYRNNDVFSGTTTASQYSNRGNGNRRNIISNEIASNCGHTSSYDIDCHRRPVDKGRERNIPPAHPFQHLLAKGVRRTPKYTYKRTRKAPLSEAECTDTEDDDSLVGTKRSRTKKISRSSSLGALSDSDNMSQSSQDPALWLTTPRKRLRRRASATMGAGDTEKTRMGMQPQSFSSRLEKIITNPGSACANTYKARSLHSHLVSLGELLWLGCPSSGEGCTMRVLPLKVQAAFRLGEAVALSNGCCDLDYLDELYDSMPIFLVRFALWQHIVTLCYMRIPAYADTLSEALWDVGAFYQQMWLVGTRLADLDMVGALLKPGCIVPLHLRAVDMGAEPWFVTKLLGYLLSRNMAKAKETENIAVCAKKDNTLWREFVLPSIAGCGDSGDAIFSYSRVHGTASGVVPSRFSKWVARISNPTQSVRLLAAALEQALLFLVALGETSFKDNDTSAIVAADRVTLLYVDRTMGIPCFEAVETVKAISSIIYTKLGSLDAAFSGSDSITVTQCLQRCVLLLDKITAICNAGQQRFSADVVEACATCQTGLVLIALRQLGACRSEQPLCSFGCMTQMWGWVVCASKKLFQRTVDNRAPGFDLENIDRNNNNGLVASKRSMLVAQFDSVLDSSNGSSNSTGRKCAVMCERRYLDMALQHLVLAGASPWLFYDSARLVAYDLKRPKTGKSIVAQALARFDSIWDQHRECRDWQQNWTQLQLAAEHELQPQSGAQSQQGALSGSNPQNMDSNKAMGSDAPNDDESALWMQGEEAVARSRLRELSDDLDKRISSKAAGSRGSNHQGPSNTNNGNKSRSNGCGLVPKQQIANIPSVYAKDAQPPGVVIEDELGLMLSLRRRRSPT